MENYYEILQVKEEDSIDSIKASYKKLIKRYHPDITTEDKELALNMTKRINVAYEILSNPIKREEYNSQLRDMVENNGFRKKHSETSDEKDDDIKQKKNYENAYSEKEKSYDFDSEFEGNGNYEEKDGWGSIVWKFITRIISTSIIIYILRSWNVDWFWCKFVILISFILLRKSLIEECIASYDKIIKAKIVVNIAIITYLLVIGYSFVFMVNNAESTIYNSKYETNKIMGETEEKENTFTDNNYNNNREKILFYLLQELFPQSCKIKIPIIASPNSPILQTTI